MNEKKIVKIFGGIDEKYIREANEDMNFWLESQEVVVVRVDGSRKFTWRTIIASVACTAAALFGVFVLMLNVGKIGILEKPESYTEASDPMTNMSGNQSNNTSGSGSDQKVLGSYSFGFNQGDVDFSTDKLVLTPTVTGDEYPTILGVMAFVDGFPQKYSLNPSTEKKTLSVIETTPSKVGYDLNLDPKFDMELDAHYATMLYILDPDFKPENGNSFGMHHSASHWYSQPINTNGKELQKADVNALKTKSVPFSKKQTEQYNKVLQLPLNYIKNGRHIRSLSTVISHPN